MVVQKCCFSFSLDGVNVQILFIRAFSTISSLVLTDRFNFYTTLNRKQHITFWSFVWVWVWGEEEGVCLSKEILHMNKASSWRFISETHINNLVTLASRCFCSPQLNWTAGSCSVLSHFLSSKIFKIHFENASIISYWNLLK